MWNKILSEQYLGSIALIAFCSLVTVAVGNISLLPESKVRIDVQWPAADDVTTAHLETTENVLYMTSVDKEMYKCILPATESGEELLDDFKKYKGPTPLELLKPLFSQLLCYFRIDSYWSYELCHGYYVRQFHEETNAKGRVSQEFFLGKYDLKKQFTVDNKALENNTDLGGELPTVRVGDVELPYWSMNMTDGTFCGLSEKPRFTRVFYVCHPRGNNAMYSFREISSCEYEVIVLTTVLCKHPAFRIEYFSETVVNCYPLHGSPNKPQRLKKAEEEQQKEAIARTNAPVEKEEKSTEDEVVKPEPIKKILQREKAIIPHDQKLIDDVLSGSYCLRGGSGWWHFEFCYGKHVDQYHKAPEGKTVILLGMWNEDRHLAWLKNNPHKKPKLGPDLKQVSHYYSDGSYCEEAGRYRSVEVKLRCKADAGHPDSVSLYMEEPRVCDYVLVVESPMFCTLLTLIDENGLTESLKRGAV